MCFELGHGTDGRIGGYTTFDNTTDGASCEVQVVWLVDLIDSKHALDIGETY